MPERPAGDAVVAPEDEFWEDMPFSEAAQISEGEGEEVEQQE
jgi:hypothetical protein